MILVAHASKHGSTAEVAATVAAALREAGLDAELREAASVEAVDGYDGVVLGGSLYTGRWHRDARRFLQRHRDALGRTTLAVFALGPRTLEPADVAASRAQLDRALGGVEPDRVAVFGGVLDPERLAFPFNRMPPVDARDRDAIEAWAADVADVVMRNAPHTMRPCIARI